MKYVALHSPATAGRRLSFFLAMEEWVARHLDGDDYFFLWQVEPSVIFGRNQLLENEVNVAYCREHGIQMFRRKSGGGCVYADQGNIMLSYITKEENTSLAFYTFINMILLVLHKMGITATSTSHNDVLVDGKKVSGTACHLVAGHSIVHGTLLYDTNMEHMLNAITPGPEKLQAKGIQSVRQRITLLKDYLPLSQEMLKAGIKATLCTGEHQLTADDEAAIEQLEQDYLDKDFINLYK